MAYSSADIVFLFSIHSFVGWLWETIYCSTRDKKFAYRDLLVGPHCPVYGFAVTTVLLVTEPFQSNILWPFLSGLLIATAFEYAAGWLLETVFHIKLWDYSQKFGNIRRHVAPRISPFWGSGIVVLVEFIQLGVMWLISHLSDWVALGVVVVMTADLIWAVVGMVKFQQAAIAFEKYVHAEQEELCESVRTEADDLTQQTEVSSKRLEDLRLHINEALGEKEIEPFRLNQRRMFRNYKNFRLTMAPFLNEIHKQTAALKEKHNRKNNH